MIDINNRRYIGSKYKLLEYIERQIKIDSYKNVSFADIFAGTGIVGYYFAKKGANVIVNDILYSNVVAYNAFFSDEVIDIIKVTDFINMVNEKEYSSIYDNYFSNIYGNKYFSINDAKKIGYIREQLEKQKKSFNKREYYYILTSLLYATDKIANTVGHFEYFLKTKPIDKNICLDKLNLINIKKAKIYNMDSNILVTKIKPDIVYIDPPYNARQYINFYHVLENLARWNKPMEFEGNSMKFKRNELKSGYSKSIAPKLFEDLINNINAKLIIVSYNNTYDAKSIASNNKISEEQIISILNNKGKTKKIEIDYKGFNAGKTDLKNHKEFIFKCEVY